MDPLDVMLPDVSGFEVLKQIRGTSSIPMILLTARGDDVDRLVGLKIGADDYVPKPFNPRNLLRESERCFGEWNQVEVKTSGRSSVLMMSRSTPPQEQYSAKVAL